jgi:hypothetical protein
MRRAAAVISSTGRSAFRAMTAPPAGRKPDPERDQDDQRLEIAAQHALGSAERAADLDDPDDAVALDDRHRQDPDLFAVLRDRLERLHAAARIGLSLD